MNNHLVAPVQLLNQTSCHTSYLGGFTSSSVGNYTLTKLLVTGSQSCVYQGVHYKLNFPVTLKVIDKRRTDSHQLKKMIYLMKTLDFPFVEYLYEIIELKNIVILVTNFASRGSLKRNVDNNSNHTSTSTTAANTYSVPQPSSLPASLPITSSSPPSNSPFTQLGSSLSSAHSQLSPTKSTSLFSGIGSELEEGECQVIFAQLVEAVDYLHSQKNVLHRDIRAENVMIDSCFNVTLTGFSLATIFDRDQNLKLCPCGSAEYAAPEVIMNEAYGAAADVYSMGVVLYYMVFGRMPFSDMKIDHLFEKVKNNEVSFPKEPFSRSHHQRDIINNNTIYKTINCSLINHMDKMIDNTMGKECMNRCAFEHTKISESVKDLITKMLEKDRRKRITIGQIRQHPWFKSVAIKAYKDVTCDPYEQFQIGDGGLFSCDDNQNDNNIIIDENGKNEYIRKNENKRKNDIFKKKRHSYNNIDVTSKLTKTTNTFSCIVAGENESENDAIIVEEIVSLGYDRKRAMEAVATCSFDEIGGMVRILRRNRERLAELKKKQEEVHNRFQGSASQEFPASHLQLPTVACGRKHNEAASLQCLNAKRAAKGEGFTIITFDNCLIIFRFLFRFYVLKIIDKCFLYKSSFQYLVLNVPKKNDFFYIFSCIRFKLYC